MMPESEGAVPDHIFSRIVTHDDFDGVVSAALCSLAEGPESFSFSSPGDVLEANSGVVDGGTIVCDLPHHPAAGLWFDHHVGNLEDYQLKGGDPGAIQGRFAPEKSCARVIFNHYAEKVQFPDFMENTVQEADTIDSFDYVDIEDWQKETPGKMISNSLSNLFPTRKERNRYLRHLIRMVRTAPLEGVLMDPEVKARVGSYQEVAEKNRILIEKIASFVTGDTEQDVILLDTTGMKHSTVLIKNLAFLSFPRARAVLEVKSLFRQKRKTNDLGFSMSLSPCVQVETSGKDVGEIMRTLNMGDGHLGAGAGRLSCGSKALMLKKKEQTVQKILSLWNQQVSGSDSAHDEGSG